MKAIARIFTGLLTAGLVTAAYAAQDPASGMMNEPGMMDGGMMMGGGMMVACILFGVLVLVALVLGIFALIKYLRSKG